jgi:hypothetical protein
MVRAGNEVGSDGIEKIGAHGVVFENGSYEIIHGEERLLLGVYPDSVIDFGPLGIVTTMPRVAIEGSHTLAIFEDHHFPVKSVGVLKNPIDQSS